MQTSSPRSSRESGDGTTISSDGRRENEAARPPPRSPEHARLHESFKDDRVYLPKMIALDKNKRSTRVDAILALKGSIEKSSSGIQSRNAMADRHVREREEQDAKRFDELLNQGLNPYEVARARSVREVAQKERKQIEQRIQDKQVSILKHLEVEKVWIQRQERIAEEQRAYEKKYQKEMGRAAVEERTKQYLVSRTGKETMDPTGKAFRLYPSQETTVKDRSFGLGQNLVHNAEQRHRIVDKVHRKRAHRDSPGAEPSAMLLPRYGETSGGSSNSNNNDSERASSPSGLSASLAAFAAAPTAVIPGQELEEFHSSVLEQVTDTKGSRAALPPLPGSSPSTGGEASAPTKPKKGFGKPHRSVLEQRMLEQARERQKSNIIQKQVVWGKEFTGRAFLADPPEIWFKDFEVGEPMVLAFTLTNVSNTFNHFKLLDLDSTIKEFFEVKYEKPGRMSAGMACRISITFTAIQARDIDSAIPALAQTGPFSIPLRCTCKKAIPVMEARSLAFRDVVAGEKQVLSLKLENRGALPLEFCVRRIKRPGGLPRDPSVPELEDEDNTLDGEDPGGDALEEQTEADKQSAELALNGVQAAVATSSPTEPNAGTADEDTQRTNEDELNGEHERGEEDGDESEVSGTLSNSASGVSIAGNVAVLTQSVALSDEEQAILDNARAATVFKPDGADTPIRHTVSGTVAPYSSASIAFTFTPAAPMELDDELFLVEFPQSSTSYRSSFWAAQLLAPMPVSISAHASRVPIFVARQELDFRCCLYDRLYRDQLVVCNRGSVALKMQIRVPKALDGCVEFHPNMGFVQGAAASSATGSSPSSGVPQGDSSNAGVFPVQIKFRPNTEMWKRLEAKSFGNAALGFIAVPIQIVVPDQVVPVYFILQARLSSAALSFSQKRLDFGACTLGHSTTHLLEVTNTSRLPQRLAFVKLPPDIRFENPISTCNNADDGVATLLPDETKALRVVYLPSASATTLAGRLVCRTTMNDEYVIPVTGECVATPLVFSHTVVQLAATQLGQMQTYSISCANSSDKPQTMELVVPAEGKNVLRVTPAVATVPPRGSVRVELEFTAAEELFELPASEYETTESSQTATAPLSSITVNTSRNQRDRIPPDVKAVTAGIPVPPAWVAANGVPAEERSVHHTWTVLCFRQPSSLVAFQVCTTVIEPRLFSTPRELDFGQVAIGQSLVRELVFTNQSVHEVLLRSRPLHALGGFRMINSLQRTISARGGTRVLKMEFRPQSPLLYEDELELSCPELGVIRVALRGEGVNPSLRIVPEDGVIDFKDVLARSRTTNELQLTNASGFPLTLAIVPLPDASAPQTTSAGLPVFTFSPSEATIPAQATLTVKVLFFPDHERPQQYRQQFLIQVPNESERHVVSLAGRCWENQLYVLNPQEPPKLFAAPPVEDLFDVPPAVNLSALLGGGLGGVLTAALLVPAIKKAPSPLTVVFDSETLASETKTVFVGATLAPAGDDDTGGTSKPAGGAPAGSFELTIDENPERPHYAKLFSLEPAKGTLSAGQQLPVHVTYQRPAAPSAAAGSDEEPAHPELVVAQWIQVRVTCTLRGGALWRPLPAATPAAATTAAGSKGAAAAATAADSDARVVHLVLRAKMLT